jgi:hypothetical protein
MEYMITTPETVLDETSAVINENTTDTTAKRVRLFNRACRKVIHDYKWSFRKKTYTLTTSVGVSTYDLTTLITDYDPVAGLFAIDGLYPTEYDFRADGGTYYYLTPDNETLGFTFDVTATTYTITYYALYVNVAAYNTTLNLSIPDTFKTIIVTYLKHLVHDAKRQRHDARNAIIDYKEQLSDIKLAEASNKISSLPKTVPHIMSFRQMKRSYTY